MKLQSPNLNYDCNKNQHHKFSRFLTPTDHRPYIFYKRAKDKKKNVLPSTKSKTLTKCTLFCIRLCGLHNFFFPHRKKKNQQT